MTKFVQPVSENIWNLKYRHKTFDGVNLDDSVEDTWARISEQLAFAEKEQGRVWRKEDFYEVLEDFKFIPAGRIISGSGTNRNVTLVNCFTMGTIPDSLVGIFDHLKEAVLTMQQGGGIGYDFSTLRPKGAHVKGVDADSSGPLSFMDVWDSMCRTIMSAGSRRGAMMATMRCDHPDIEDFIKAKRTEGRMRMFNLSVMCSDRFLNAVKNDLDWDLHFEGKVYKTLKAKHLWQTIMLSTYEYAEPGVLFIDRINDMNNTYYYDTIATTNPCGEKCMGPYSSCVLGSINLPAFVVQPFFDRARLDYAQLQNCVKNAVRMLDNVIDVTKYPLQNQKDKSISERQIGLGVTGVGSMLIMMKMTYGSDQAVQFMEELMKFINDTAYNESVELAIEKGSFPLFDADKFLDSGFMKTRSELLRSKVRKYGIRNSLLTSIAPTGTISLYANNVSSGIEPVFALYYERKVLNNDGSHTKELVMDYAVYLWRKLFGAEPLPDYFVTAQTLSPIDHIRMQSAVQKHVDSAISKTTNCPEDISFEDFQSVYLMAYDMGCKGCTTYRPNEVLGSVLTVIPEPVATTVPNQMGACAYDSNTGVRTCES